MKNKLMGIVCILTMTAMIVGCGSKQGTDIADEQQIGIQEQSKIKVVTTIFPEYDWAREIIGANLENVELTMLLDNGVDLHSYEATADDIIAIQESDLFIYVGGESDAWIDGVLENAANKDMKVINLMEILGDSVKVEEMVEGMQESEHHHDHDDVETEVHDHHHDDVETEEHDHHHDDSEVEEHEHDHEVEVENDEHVWLSLTNAKMICTEIARALSEIDNDNVDLYNKNLDVYVESLDALDQEFRQAIENSKHDTILVGDRFPFRYLVDDYDLNYYAAFVGCSAETEASFETITFLASKVDEEQLSTVLTIDGSDLKIAETIIANTKDNSQTIETLNSLQSIGTIQVEEGITYFSAMKDNLEVLKKVLK